MNIETWVLILVPSVAIAAAALWFTISYARRDPKRQQENIEMLKNVDEALKKGEITPEDAKTVRESVEGTTEQD